MQIASCANCRYRYELVSGNVVSIESEEIRLVFKTGLYIMSLVIKETCLCEIGFMNSFNSDDWCYTFFALFLGYRKNVAFEMCLQCFLMVIYSCMVLILGFNFLRNYSCRTQHGYSSMGKGAEVSADIEAEHSCSCSLHRGISCFLFGFSFRMPNSKFNVFFPGFNLHVGELIPLIL